MSELRIVHIDPLTDDQGPWEATCGVPVKLFGYPGDFRRKTLIDHSDYYHDSPDEPRDTDNLMLPDDCTVIWCPKCVELLPLATLSRIDDD